MIDFFYVIDFISDACIIINKNGTIEATNKSVERVFGYMDNQLIGKSINTLLDPKLHTAHNESLRKYFENPIQRRMGLNLQTKGLHKKGHPVKVEISLSSFVKENTTYALAIVASFAKYEEEIQKLTTERNSLIELIGNNKDHIFQIDHNFRILYINHVHESLKFDQVIGRDLRDFWKDVKERDSLIEKVNSAFETGNTISFDLTFTTPQGSTHYKTIATPVIYNGMVKKINLVSRDITKENFIQKQLLSKNRFIDKINNNSLNGIYIYDLNKGVFTYTNQRYQEILGYNLHEMNSFDREEFYSLYHPDDQENIAEHINKLLTSSQDQNHQITFRILTKSGIWKWCQAQDAVFETDHSGKVTTYISSFIDVTDYKEAEARLILKNREVENFVFIASHDIKSPLVNLQESIKLAKTNKLNERDNLLDLAISSSQRLERLVHSLLDFSALDKKHPQETFNLETVIRNVLLDLDHLIKDHKAQIKSLVNISIKGHEASIYQLFLNLIQNALKYRQEETPPIVSIYYEELMDHYLIMVKDNGVGILPKHFDRIFEIFQRAPNKKRVEGLGIGLANCKKIVEQHGGNLWVESTLGKGSIFKFTMPKSSN